MSEEIDEMPEKEFKTDHKNSKTQRSKEMWYDENFYWEKAIEEKSSQNTRNFEFNM